MKSPILRLSEALHDIDPILRRALGDASVADITNQLAETEGPTVMLFGTYNAGKSTLINALIGADLAAVSSQPETCVVASYSWNGFTLLDTPGIDAPVEHEEISREQLRRSDVVLFVLSADAPVEEQAPYGEIASLLKADKRVILILNTRGGHQEVAGDFQRLRERVLENLRAAGVTAVVPICLVNAKTMRRGRETGKAALLEHSGYPTLERELLDMLRSSNSFGRACTRGRQLIAVIEAALTALEGSQVSTEGRDLSQLESKIFSERKRLEGDVEQTIGREGQALRAALRDAQDITTVQAAWDKSAEAIHERIGQLFEKMSKRLEVDAMDMVKLTLRGEAPVGRSPDDQAKSLGDGSGLLKTLKASFNMSNLDASALAEIAGREGISAALLATKKIAPGLMKGIGPKTIASMSGKVATVAGRAVGPALQILTFALEYRNAQAAERREAEDKEERQRQLHDYLDRSAKEFVSETRLHYEPMVEALFDPLEQQIAEQRGALSDSDKLLANDFVGLRRADLRIKLILREEGAQDKEPVPA